MVTPIENALTPPRLFAAVRLERIKSMAALEAATRHANRLDETSKLRCRPGSNSADNLAYNPWADLSAERSGRFDYVADFKVMARALKARERGNTAPVAHVICVVSREWIAEAGGEHEAANERNQKLFEEAIAWIGETFGASSIVSARMDLDEQGAGVVDVLIAPIEEGKKGTRFFSVSPTLRRLQSSRKTRNTFSALQDVWAEHAQKNLDLRIRRGEEKQGRGPDRLSPEAYAAKAETAKRTAQLDLRERQLEQDAELIEEQARHSTETLNEQQAQVVEREQHLSGRARKLNEKEAALAASQQEFDSRQKRAEVENAAARQRREQIELEEQALNARAAQLDVRRAEIAEEAEKLQNDARQIEKERNDQAAHFQAREDDLAQRTEETEKREREAKAALDARSAQIENRVAKIKADVATVRQWYDDAAERIEQTDKQLKEDRDALLNHEAQLDARSEEIETYFKTRADNFQAETDRVFGKAKDDGYRVGKAEALSMITADRERARAEGLAQADHQHRQAQQSLAVVMKAIVAGRVAFGATQTTYSTSFTEQERQAASAAVNSAGDCNDLFVQMTKVRRKARKEGLQSAEKKAEELYKKARETAQADIEQEVADRTKKGMRAEFEKVRPAIQALLGASFDGRIHFDVAGKTLKVLKASSKSEEEHKALLETIEPALKFGLFKLVLEVQRIFNEARKAAEQAKAIFMKNERSRQSGMER